MIERFVILDAKGEEIGTYTTLDEARSDVPEGQPWAIVAYQFEFADSELVETSTGANTWPPKAGRGRKAATP